VKVTNATADGAPTNCHALPLLPHHLADLRQSGLLDETIREHGYYSESNGRRVHELLGWKPPANGESPLGSCLVLPFCGTDGKPTGYARLKPDRPRLSKKEGDTKPVKYEAPKGKPPQAYFPVGVAEVLRDPSTPLVIVEGEKKAAAVRQAGLYSVGISGVYAWQQKRKNKSQPRKLIPDLDALVWGDRAVTIIFDSDVTEKPTVQWAEWHFAEALRSRGATVKVVRLGHGSPGPDGKPTKWGVDDFLVAHGERGPEALRELLSRAAAPEKPKDRRPTVRLGVEEHLAVREAVEALAQGDDQLYQRGGQLVRVVCPEQAAQHRRFRPSGSLRVEAVPLPDLRRRLTEHARCVVVIEKNGKTTTQRAHPAGWLVEGVAALGAWPGIRHLEAVVESPVLRHNGTVLDRPGYDRETGLLYRPRGAFLLVPSAPTRGDAERACAELLDVVSDFPFARPEHRSAYLSGVLTPVARFAFDGPGPLHGIDANVRAAGKGLLADATAEIVAGGPFARAAYSHDNDEMGKVITALALAGERLVLLDNLTGTTGGANLDAALTSTEWQGRILGKSQQPRVLLWITWYATGNNLCFRADTARRVLQVRLESQEERPEERTGFKYPDLLAYVRQERGRLLVAALTILSAYCRASRPMPSGLKPWGSFEGWSALVRGALVWAGQADPGLARMSTVEGADREAAALQGLLAGWEELDPRREGLTVKQALDLLKGGTPESYPTMRAVLAEFFDLKAGEDLKSGALAYRLRGFRGRNCGGKWFTGVENRGGVNVWTVRGGPPAGAGDEGDAGDVSPDLRAGARDESVNKERQAGETSPASPASPAPEPEPTVRYTDDLREEHLF
jgi:hypothetical protein